jgi:hypothetical protein|uniref:Uncharacterized protein n=1 Tax=viral metagenome TaxID=1070528 RepID=A0A6C0BZD3_9ZZZZ
MKIKKLHLFLIIIGVLLLGSLGFTIREGFDAMRDEIDDGMADQIGEGDNSDYVLKSSIVPPVCPKCPQRTSCPRKEACPPCPRPKRCPEAPFECKKVPNYASASTSSNLPLPMLNSFSQF